MEHIDVAKALLVHEEGGQRHLLLLTRSADDPCRPGQFDLPGGGVDDGESLRSAVVREIFEEVGMEIDPDCEGLRKPVYTRETQEQALGDASSSVAVGKVITRHIFSLEVSSTHVSLGPEHTEALWVPFDHVEHSAISSRMSPHHFAAFLAIRNAAVSYPADRK